MVYYQKRKNTRAEAGVNLKLRDFPPLSAKSKFKLVEKPRRVSYHGRTERNGGISMAFGERLQEVRKQSGMTQETFAEQLHVSRQAVSRWESGRGYPEIEKLLYICRRCHVTLDTLFADELPPQETAVAPEEAQPPLAGKPLKRAFDDFLSNLSPYDKLIGGTLIFIVLLSLMALAHSMKGGSGSNMTFIWIAAIVVFGIAEAATAGLVSIWFVAGAVAALLAVQLDAALWLQIVVFLAVSIAALVATRPLARKMLDKTIVPTNADRVLHHPAKVVEEIDNENARGAVYTDGKTWTARSEDGAVIPRGTMVTVVRMEGVKLFVREKKEEQ